MADYSIPKSYIENASNNINLFNNAFNVNNTATPYNHPTPLRGYVFMTKPNLNIGTSDESNTFKDLQKVTNNALSYYAGMSSFPEYVKLLSETYQNSKKGYIAQVTNRIKTYTANDKDIKTLEKGTSFYGHSISYGKHSEDHNKGNSITLDFTNDADNSMLILFDIWASYIDSISRGYIIPRFSDVYEGVLDYAASIYFLVVDNTDTIVYWEKLVGWFPTRIPYSIFKKDEYPSIEDTISIEGRYSFRDDSMNPSILADLDYITGDPYKTVSRYSLDSSLVGHTSNGFGGGHGYIGADAPYVVLGADGKYKLKWVLTSVNSKNNEVGTEIERTAEDVANVDNYYNAKAERQKAASDYKPYKDTKNSSKKKKKTPARKNGGKTSAGGKKPTAKPKVNKKKAPVSKVKKRTAVLKDTTRKDKTVGVLED